MDRHSSSAMFISEIPVRCTRNGQKRIEWFTNLNRRTTARDVIDSLLSPCTPENYCLYVHLDETRQALNDSARIYRVVAKINQQCSSRRLLFEIAPQKRVTFADEVNLRRRLELLKENFRKHAQMNSSAAFRRSSLRVINRNLPQTSSESGISSDDSLLSTKPLLETLV